MIAILIVYASVAVAEWRYVRRSKRKKRTRFIIFGSISFWFCCFRPLERVLLGQW